MIPFHLVHHVLIYTTNTGDANLTGLFELLLYYEIQMIYLLQTYVTCRSTTQSAKEAQSTDRSISDVLLYQHCCCTDV